MWRSFHRLRTSQTFCDSWKAFLEADIHQSAHPSFYQWITTAIFKSLIEATFPAVSLDDVREHPDRPLNLEEKNALRYVAGHVCRKIRHTLERSAVKGKDEMIFCLLSFAGDESDDEGETELWTNAIDRGGLWHISDIAYMFFVVVEEEARRFFTVQQLDWFRTETNPKEKVIQHILSDPDVLFQWALLTASLSNELALVLLEKVVTLYVTIRGFGFATSCIEMFKQITKSNLQKKKALRKSIGHS